MGWAGPAGMLALLRGVSAAGWMGRMPATGVCAWPALGRWRGVMEVSVVGTGSVSLRPDTQCVSITEHSTVCKWDANIECLY